jgi:exodeoxyribonuclease V alpha subunit
MSGQAAAALTALEGHRLLCAHRRGLRGVAYWSSLVARWLAEVQPVVPREDGHYVGEPLLVTTNDYDVGLYNGDTGIVYEDVDRGPMAAFGRGGDPIVVPLVRLGAVSRLHAMTVHRSQGSQFDVVTVVLPPADSALGTRETLYTAATRAVSKVRLIGSPKAVIAACARPAARATGLASRLQ